METTAERPRLQHSPSPIREQRGPALFMVFLLIISGLTASVVGYRVKSADIDRKAQLLSAYESLGGSFERANTPGQSITSEQLNADQRTFALAYEINSRARTHGLYRILETTPPETMPQAIQSLFVIDAREAARSAEDAWNAFQEPAVGGAVVRNMNPKAARFARQYDRYLARDTEVKLFRYLRDHSTTIRK